MSDTPLSLATPPEGHGDWLADLKNRIHNARQRAKRAINREMVQLYCQATAPSWRMNHSD